MKPCLKKHILKIDRYQTSLGRDLKNGMRLDRNERVSNFDDDTLKKIWKAFPSYSFSASPESGFLYKKIAKSIKMPEENIFITNGITEGIKFLYEFLSAPGDNVVVLDPTYPFYEIYAKVYRLKYRKFGFKKDLSVNWNSFYKNIDKKTRFVVIPNPNLPIESCFTLDQIREMANHCRKTNTLLIIDEAYHFFGGPSSLSLIREFDNLIVMRTFSKAYGLASLRLGFMISNEKIINYVSKARSLVESNTFSMGIASYMLDNPYIMKAHIKEVKKGAKYLQSVLCELGYKWYGGNVSNGILIFLDNSEWVSKIIAYLKTKKIYIRGSFKGLLAGCIRVSIGSKNHMEKFIREFIKGMKKIK